MLVPMAMASNLTRSLCYLVLILVSYGSSLDSNPCGDWVAFKNEDCVKLVERSGFQNKEDAEIICKTLGEEIHSEDVPRLVIVKTEEKQKFLQKLLYEELGIVDDIWLGLELGNDSVYHWNDGTDLYYTNWAKEPYADHDQKCVQMEGGDGTYEAGKWTKASCKKRNAVVCEKTQPWAVITLQNMLLNMKLETDKNKQELEKNKQELEKNKQELEKTKTELETVKQESQKEIANLKGNPVPLGFIYVQLPGKDSPTKLWPQAKWKDVGSEYAGLFFRVEGGGAAAFGQEQGDNTRRLAQVYYSFSHPWTDPEIPSDGSWSQFAYTGDSGGGGNQRGLQFRLTTGEVRPRNKSVKIWQRIK